MQVYLAKETDQTEDRKHIRPFLVVAELMDEAICLVDQVLTTSKEVEANSLDMSFEKIEKFHLDPGGCAFIGTDPLEFEVDGATFTLFPNHVASMLELLPSWEEQPLRCPGYARGRTWRFQIIVPLRVMKPLESALFGLLMDDEALHASLTVAETFANNPALGGPVPEESLELPASKRKQN